MLRTTDKNLIHYVEIDITIPSGRAVVLRTEPRQAESRHGGPPSLSRAPRPAIMPPGRTERPEPHTRGDRRRPSYRSPYRTVRVAPLFWPTPTGRIERNSPPASRSRAIRALFDSYTLVTNAPVQHADEASLAQRPAEVAKADPNVSHRPIRRALPSIADGTEGPSRRSARRGSPPPAEPSAGSRRDRSSTPARSSAGASRC